MTKEKENYSIYNIKKEDTLASVATFFEKTQQEIKGFHNIFCTSEEYIVFDLPDHLKQLYVYPYLHYKAIGVAEHLSESTYLHHNKPSGSCNYNVQYSVAEGEKNTIINFEISVIHQGIFKEGHLYLINKKATTTINGEIDINDTEEIKEKIGNIAYPLQVLVSESGMWQEVVFDKNIKNRFAAAKQEVQEYYKGKLVDDLLNHAESNLCSEAGFKKIFENNWLLDTIFSPIYKYYNYKQPIKDTVKFKLLNHTAPILFDAEQNIADFEYDSKLITIFRKGILSNTNNSRTLEKVNEDAIYDSDLSQIASGSISQKIILDLKTFNIKSIYLLANIDLQTPRKVEVKVDMI